MHQRERRQDTRAQVATTAVVLARKNTGVALTIDSISTGGARLVGPLTLAVGERVQMLFELHDTPIEVAGEVVRIETEDLLTDRIAVRFIDLKPYARLLIRELVLERMTDED